ncbi:MAG: CehA/McbA family metallohydrolase [Pirellulaceae bacterium]|nr:CehA/McbA family metallohydrolase [Pirellulaceae bacterium]
MKRLLFVLLLGSCWVPLLLANERILTNRLHHVRNGKTPEWSSFPEQAEASSLEISFTLPGKSTASTLRLRQQDVKQPWSVFVNGKMIDKLQQDENDMVRYLAVPADVLQPGNNQLTVSTDSKQGSDDIRVGEMSLFDQPPEVVLSEADVTIQVVDSEGQGIPCRLTILNRSGALSGVGAQSSTTLAVRPGVVYTAGGLARVGLQAGTYKVIAGRGFEWGIDSAELIVRKGSQEKLSLRIHREVPTEELVSCDTHVHTFTYSRHGDATIEERIITTAGEGIELPIATDHNLHIDYRPVLRRLQMEQYFTPVIGNEVTTSVGHFNIFPVNTNAPLPNHRLTTWPEIIASIRQTPQVQAIILNHGRDLHSNVRPLGPAHHLAVTGQNRHGWGFGANAMELINSGATQTDIMQLVHDWFGLLNRGYAVTPVGCSDSHDVARHFVGQGRTYIRCPDHDPGKIPVDQAVRSFVAGRVIVSYGLLTTMRINDQYSMGDLVPAGKPLQLEVAVLGPSWTEADVVELYANGKRIKQEIISPGGNAGIKWKGNWQLAPFQHDVHLVAVARGPGIESLHWPTAKAYQPTSPDWTAAVFSCTGAVWLDVDGDGKPTSAYQYAQQVMKQTAGKIEPLLRQLANYDVAVAAQAAALLQAKTPEILLQDEFQQVLAKAADPVRQGIQVYLNQWRQSQTLPVLP